MKSKLSSCAAAMALMLPLFCSPVVRCFATRKLPIPKAPLVEQNVTPDSWSSS